MSARTSRPALKLKTKTVTVQIIGGEKDYTALRVGYYLNAEGLRPSYKFKKLTPEVKLYNVQYAQYIPYIGYSVASTKYGQVYRWNLTDAYKFVYAGLVNSGAPAFTFACHTNGDVACVMAGGPRIAVINPAAYKMSTFPVSVVGGAYFKGRLFGIEETDRYKIKWSGLQFDDWTESIDGSGYLRLEPSAGKALNIVEYGGKLVVVREYGVTVLNVYGEPRHFAVESTQVMATAEPNLFNTSSVCGGKLYFCSQTAVFVYDGANIALADAPMQGELSGFGNAKQFNDRFLYFTCTYAGDGKNYVLEWDLLTGDNALFCPDGTTVWRTPEGCYAFINDFTCAASDDGDDMESLWKSKSFDLGDFTAVKTLKKIFVERGKGNAQITVHADGVTRVAEGDGEITLGLRGRSFSFEVSGQGEIKRLYAEWEERV